MSTPNATTPQQIAAAMLHRKCCKDSHANPQVGRRRLGGCAWYLENSWEDSTHSVYLKLAVGVEKILKAEVIS